jgi:hypothetical protein
MTFKPVADPEVKPLVAPNKPSVAPKKLTVSHQDYKRQTCAHTKMDDLH